MDSHPSVLLGCGGTAREQFVDIWSPNYQRSEIQLLLSLTHILSMPYCMSMDMQNSRITITIPRSVVKEIDSQESNRSRFVLDAVLAELARRKREELRVSLRNPHSESFVDEGAFEDWEHLDDDAAELVDPDAGLAVEWVSGEGWTTGE